MRSVLPAIAVFLVLLVDCRDAAMAFERRLRRARRRTSPAPPAAAPRGADRDAAAKHAKRTACIKNAKAKKLVGAQKTAFIKECMAAP